MKSSFYILKHGKLHFQGNEAKENKVVVHDTTDSICSAGLLHTFKRGNSYVTEVKY